MVKVAPCWRCDGATVPTTMRRHHDLAGHVFRGSMTWEVKFSSEEVADLARSTASVIQHLGADVQHEVDVRGGEPSGEQHEALERDLLGGPSPQVQEFVQVEIEGGRDLLEQRQRRRPAPVLEAADRLRVDAHFLGELRLRHPEELAMPRDLLPKPPFDGVHRRKVGPRVSWLACLRRRAR